MINWDELVESVNSAGNKATDSIKQTQEWLNSSGFQDMTVRDFMSPFEFGGATPSPRRYAECKEANGKSGWDSNGVWQCLFPNSPPQTLYGDYRQFLEERNIQYLKRRQAVQATQVPSRTPSSHPRLISAEEGKGKPVTSRSVNIESTTDDDGKLVVKRRSVTYYNDNTATVDEKEDRTGWFWRD